MVHADDYVRIGNGSTYFGSRAVFSVYRYFSVVCLWGIERSGFFNGREKWAKGFENQRV